MADRRRGKQRRREGEPEKPTKEEYAVAKHLRFNLPTREGKLVGMAVQYFIASKAVDMLLESKWGVSAKNGALFTTRNACIEYCNNLLSKGIFHRAARIGKRKDRDGVKKKKKLKDTEEETKESKEEEKKQAKLEKRIKKKEKKKEGEEEDTEKDKDKESDGEKEEKRVEKEKKEEEKKDEEKRRKKKVKLEMHEHQIFKDGDEIYVWIYDPVPFKTFIIGLLLVLGAIAVCMFPLWPPEVRLGIYYLSLAAAGFVGIILALCVIRLILFCLIWGLTLGKHHFWFLPNLTEDVGFFDSFRPLYKHDYYDGKSEPDKDKVTDPDDKRPELEKKDKKEGEKDEEKASDKEESVEGSEDNGYEIVDREEFLQKEEGEQGSEQEEAGEEEEEEEEEGEEEEEQSEETKKTK